MTLPPLTEAQRSAWEERSAILEFDAGLSRAEAEREALRLVLKREAQGSLELEKPRFGVAVGVKP